MIRKETSEMPDDEFGSVTRLIVPPPSDEHAKGLAYKELRRLVLKALYERRREGLIDFDSLNLSWPTGTVVSILTELEERGEIEWTRPLSGSEAQQPRGTLVRERRSR
jgi:hypothetical protein